MTPQKNDIKANLAQEAAKRIMRNMTMSRFVVQEREMPDKRKVDTRRKDFNEIYTAFNDQSGEDQAARCAQCGIPFCQSACPLHNNIPDWLMLAAAGRWYEAYQCASATNPLPEICGRICPQDRLCEGDCVIEQSDHGAVTIGAVEAYITDRAWHEGWITSPKCQDSRGQSIGIIGSGPAGLAAAEVLGRAGFEVVIYDRHDRAGGLLVYGIPNFKLDKILVQRRIDLLKEMGITFRLNCQIGTDLSFAEFRSRHNAVLIATGVYQPRVSACTWPDEGVIAALPFLIASNRRNFGDTLSSADDTRTDMTGQRLLVIGGGDTAMDCVRTAIRQGAKSVTCVYRRDRDNMPGSRRELIHSEEEGVSFSWLLEPRAYTTKAGSNQLDALEAQPMRTERTYGAERHAVAPSDDPTTQLKCDRIIEALGFTPEPLHDLFDTRDLNLDDQGRVRTSDSSGHTSLPGVFAAGDIVRGASLVVWAVRDGLDAARGIRSYLDASRRKAA